MKVINWYIVREVLKGSFVALVVLLMLFNLFTLTDELKDIGKGDYHLREVFLFVLLTSPTVIYELMPSAGLLGSLFVLGAMANNRELIAMQASGLSVFGIIRAIMLAGLVLAALAVSIGEFIAPDAEHEGQMLRSAAQNKQVVMQTLYGLWLREGNAFINVRQITTENKLVDISVYELNTNYQLTNMLHADQADFISPGNWTLTEIRNTKILGDSTQVGLKKQTQWNSNIAPELLNSVLVTPDNLSLYDLYGYIEFLQNNKQKTLVYELAFWGRIVNPLVIFVMLLVSAPFVIGVRRGSSVGTRIIIGVLIGMSFNVFSKIASHLGLVYDLNPILVATLPSLSVLAVALYAIARIKV